MAKGMTKVLGLGCIAAGIGLGYCAWKRGVFGLITARQGMAGRVTNRRERERARAEAFLSRVTGRQTRDPYAEETVQEVSGMASGQARAFRALLHRNAREGRDVAAHYGDLGVVQ